MNLQDIYVRDIQGNYAVAVIRWQEWTRVQGPQQSGERLWQGTLLVDSSFGVYGHTWTYCSKPFPQFLAEVETDYLLGKISRRETDEAATTRKIRDALSERYHHKELDALIAEYSGEALYSHIYDAFAGTIDLTEMAVQCWPVQAQQFVEKLWPLIRQELTPL